MTAIALHCTISGCWFGVNDTVLSDESREEMKVMVEKNEDDATVNAFEM